MKTLGFLLISWIMVHLFYLVGEVTFAQTAFINLNNVSQPPANGGSQAWHSWANTKRNYITEKKNNVAYERNSTKMQKLERTKKQQKVLDGRLEIIEKNL